MLSQRCPRLQPSIVFQRSCAVRLSACGCAFMLATAMSECAIAQTAHFTGAVRTLGSGFSSPGGVAGDAKGDVFVADFNNNAVKEIVAVNGAISASPAVVTVSTAFVAPTNLAFDAKGNLYVTEGNNLV